MDLRSAGKSPEEVIAAFVAKHGEQILMAPPAEGFNLAGYLVPGIVIVSIGALITAIILRRQTVRQSASPTEPQPLGQTVRPSDSPTATDLDRLERALTEVAD